MSNCQTGCLVFSLIHRELEIWSADRKEGEKKKIGRRKIVGILRKIQQNLKTNPTNPPDSSILISCRNDSNILYDQHQFPKITTISAADFFCCFIPHITRIHLKTQLIRCFSFLKFSVSAAFKRTGYNRPCQPSAW